MGRHSRSKRMCKGRFVPPSASLGVLGHAGDSCGFVSRRNRPPPESDSLGSFIYLPVRWRAILLPNECAKAIMFLQVLVWAFLGILGTRAGFVSPRNCPPPEGGTFGSFIYCLLQWRAILSPN